jgi:hypothetical protein
MDAGLSAPSIVSSELQKHKNAFASHFDPEQLSFLPINKTLFQSADLESLGLTRNELDTLAYKFNHLPIMQDLPEQFDCLNGTYPIQVDSEKVLFKTMRFELLRKLLDGVSGGNDCERMAYANIVFLDAVSGASDLGKRFHQLSAFEQSRLKLLRVLEERNQYNALHCVTKSLRIENFSQIPQHEQNVLKKLLLDLNVFQMLLATLRSPFARRLEEPQLKLNQHYFTTYINHKTINHIASGCIPLDLTLDLILQLCAQRQDLWILKIAFYKKVNTQAIGLQHCLEAFQLGLTPDGSVVMTHVSTPNQDQPAIVIRASKEVMNSTAQTSPDTFEGILKILMEDPSVIAQSKINGNVLLQGLRDQAKFDQTHIRPQSTANLSCISLNARTRSAHTFSKKFCEFSESRWNVSCEWRDG